MVLIASSRAVSFPLNSRFMLTIFDISRVIVAEASLVSSIKDLREKFVCYMPRRNRQMRFSPQHTSDRQSVPRLLMSLGGGGQMPPVQCEPRG